MQIAQIRRKGVLPRNKYYITKYICFFFPFFFFFASGSQTSSAVQCAMAVVVMCFSPKSADCFWSLYVKRIARVSSTYYQLQYLVATTVIEIKASYLNNSNDSLSGVCGLSSSLFSHFIL